MVTKYHSSNILTINFFIFKKKNHFQKIPFIFKNRCQTIGIHCSCCKSSSISWTNWCWWIKKIICKVSKNKQTKQKQNKKNRLKFDLRTRIFISIAWNGSNQVDLHFVDFNIDNLILRGFLCLPFFQLKNVSFKMFFFSKLLFFKWLFQNTTYSTCKNQFKKHHDLTEHKEIVIWSILIHSCNSYLNCLIKTIQISQFFHNCPEEEQQKEEEKQQINS